MDGPACGASRGGGGDQGGAADSTGATAATGATSRAATATGAASGAGGATGYGMGGRAGPPFPREGGSSPAVPTSPRRATPAPTITIHNPGCTVVVTPVTFLVMS